MNIMNRVTWKSMWENKTRTIVTIIGIVLSAAMFTAVATMAFSFWSFLVENEIYNSGDYFLRYDYTTQEHLDELEKDDRISRLGELDILGYHIVRLEEDNGRKATNTVAVAAGDDAFFDMVTVILEEGRLPQTNDELVINRNTYHFLQLSGISCEVGDTVTLEVTPEHNRGIPDDVTIPAEGEAFTKAYTIVGIADLFTRLGDHQLAVDHLFTYADEDVENALWHRAYVKTWIPMDANAMHRENPEGTYAEINRPLMELYGATQYNNYNNLIMAIAGVLLAIIMAGSVSLIYNAFSISVSERTRQFGLLASVGATRKQLRRSVYFEALALSAMGVPIGILCGFFGVAVTIEGLKQVIWSTLSAAGGTVILRAVPSVWAFLAAALVALVTVLISAWIPARRATKIAPITAIRQNQDYKIPKRGIKGGKLSQMLWGLPGLLAKKYYTVSKKKYRATVVSMTISILLFISATSIAGVLQMAADNAMNINSFDIRCYNLDREELADLRKQDFLDRTALFTNENFVTVIPEEDQAEDYLEVYDMRPDGHGFMSRCVKELNVDYLEDEILRDYLVSKGIDPEPYFDESCPMALFYQPKTMVYQTNEETGSMTMHTVKTDLFAEGVQTLGVFPYGFPDEVNEYIRQLLGDNYSYVPNHADDRIVFACAPMPDSSGGLITFPADDENAIHVTVAAEQNAVGETVLSYYLYDPETGTVEDTPLCTVAKPADIPDFRLGAMIDESPFGLYADNSSGGERVMIILPLSTVWNGGENKINLAAKINDYEDATAYLQEKEIPYDDLLASEKQARDMILMINVFSYGFILLISLISVANVFNTITTNIALRRRDFGMLRSVGMRTGELYRMIFVECLSYGVKALLWGLPMSLAINYGIQMIGSNSSNDGYLFPWGTVAVAVISVFLIVFVTMFYAVTKLRKDNPIDAIRMENT